MCLSMCLHLYDRCMAEQGGLARARDRQVITTSRSSRAVWSAMTMAMPTGPRTGAAERAASLCIAGHGPEAGLSNSKILSTKHYFRALNGLGLTSALDCAGGFLNYPRRLWRNQRTEPPGRADRAHRLSAVRAAANVGTRRLQTMERHRQAGSGRRLF